MLTPSPSASSGWGFCLLPYNPLLMVWCRHCHYPPATLKLLHGVSVAASFGLGRGRYAAVVAVELIKPLWA
jgi:hypothetical protein